MQVSCAILNLPIDILIDILFRLPIKEIIACKCTCKSLYAAISDPEFANLHYAQSEVLPIARITSYTYQHTYTHDALYLLDQLEQDEYYHLELMKFDSKLRIPLRNFPFVLQDHSINGNKDIAKNDHNYKSANSRNRFLCLSEPYRNTPFSACNEDMMMITLEQTKNQSYKVVNLSNQFLNRLNEPFRNKRPVVVCCEDMVTLNEKVHGYKVVNSCSGFLCLSEPSRNNPVVVCNPVTGEYINLPKVVKKGKNVGSRFDCGFGFSPNTNQYKVVKMYDDRLAQVHILGTGSWKNIEFGPYSGYTLAFPTYLNGVVHWFCFRYYMKLSLMVSFDCEKECFQPFSVPPLTDAYRDNVGMGVLGGCLCICESSDLSLVRVWVMKNCGVKKSWTQVFEIDMMTCSDRLLYGSYQPIKYMKNGAVLMFNYHESVLICYDPRKPAELKLLKFHPIQLEYEIQWIQWIHKIPLKYEIFAHTPSLISLVDVLAGCNVEVLNVYYSRCAGLKINGEPGAIYLYDPFKNNMEST